MQKKQLSVLVLIILCFLLGCNRETPKDESQQNYEDESNISKTNGEELVNINSELLGSTPFDVQIDKTALQTRKETETEVTIKTNLTDWGYTVSVKAKLFCPEIAGLFCRIAGLFCHDSRANLSFKPVCFGIAIK